MKTKNVSRDTIERIRVDQISPNPNQARIDFNKASVMEGFENRPEAYKCARGAQAPQGIALSAFGGLGSDSRASSHFRP